MEAVAIRMQTAFRARHRATCLAVAKDILPERNVFVPASFTMEKLDTIIRILQSDERRVCMLFGDEALAVINHNLSSTGRARAGRVTARVDETSVRCSPCSSRENAGKSSTVA